MHSTFLMTRWSTQRCSRLKEANIQRTVRRGVLPAPVLVAFLVTAFGLVTNVQAADQAITGHTVIAGDGTMPMVEFSTAQPIPRNLWAFVPQAVLDGQVPIASIYWHGDDENARFDRDRPHLEDHARRVETDVDPIAVYRPHSASKYDWRSMREINLHLALVEYIHETWGVEMFNLYGHSSGGTVAIAVAQERPHLAATVGLASPLLAIKNRQREQHYAPVRQRHLDQYDPVDHVAEKKRALRRIPILIVHDPRDEIGGPSGVNPYVKEARRRGLKIRFVKVRLNDYPYHHTQRRLGRHLRKPKGADFRPHR